MASKKINKRQVVVFARPPNGGGARILYGTLEYLDSSNGTATMTGVRQCIYYSKETGGEAGLAAVGPQAGSRVSPKVAGAVDVAGVGLVADCAPAAVAVWEAFK